jgi:SAM-dependent methyltransferase
MQSAARVPVVPRVEPLPGLPLLRGCLETAETLDQTVKIEGWILSPSVNLDSLEAYVNGGRAGTFELLARRDVADTFPWIRHALRSGFCARFGAGLFRADALNHLEFVGHQAGRPAGRFHSLFRTDFDAAAPTPPPELMVRVAGHRDTPSFKLGGLKCFGEFHEAIARHRDPASVRRLLDWGCGCGRVAVHFLLQPEAPEVHGCDVDAEAVGWCRDHLAPGSFTPVGAWPPTPYADASFDVILGYSVFTHLTRMAQAAWLEELKRILAPGGLLIASVHGPFAIAFECPPETAAVALVEGIFDENPDESLGDVVEAGYYQNTFQTREYTLREWGRHLEIVEYVEAGMNSYQDMVVMRRP